LNVDHYHGDYNDGCDVISTVERAWVTTDGDYGSYNPLYHHLFHVNVNVNSYCDVAWGVFVNV
jgi:hypothetical protein